MLFMSSDYTAKDSSKYYETQYAATEVQTTHKSKYVVKMGDSLWNISKEHLKNKHATNAEIQEMMYKIAKLNDKDSLEAINNIKANDILYLPEELTNTTNETCYVSDWFQRGTASPATPKTDKPEVKVEKSGAQLAKETTEQIKQIIDAPSTLNYNQQQLYQARAKSNIPTELLAAHGKAGVKYWTELLSGESTEGLITEKSYSYSPASKPTALHIIKKVNNNPYLPTETHMYAQIDKSGKLTKIAFNTPGIHINSISFDYELDNKGTLKKSDNFNSKIFKLEELPESEYSTLINILQEYLDKELSK